MWFGNVGGLLWRFCREKYGSRRRQTDMRAPTGNIQAQVLSAAISGYWAWLFPAGAAILNSHVKNTPIWGLRWPPLVHNRIFDETLAKNTVYTPYIYGSGQPYIYVYI
jgi:hypothetical protein